VAETFGCDAVGLPLTHCAAVFYYEDPGIFGLTAPQWGCLLPTAPQLSVGQQLTLVDSALVFKGYK